MTSLRGKGRLPLAPRAPDASPISASGTVENCCTPIVIDVPSFTECIPTNITWTGGTAPYSVFINVRDSSENLRQFVDINTPHFVWSPDVPAETLVSLQVIDVWNVLTLIEDPILVEQRPLGASCEVASALSSSVPVPGTTQSPSPFTPTGMSRNNPISGSVVAAIVPSGYSSLVVLSCESQATTEREWKRHREESRASIGKQRRARRVPERCSIDKWTIYGNSERVSYAEIFTASPMSDPDDMTPTQFIGSESQPSSPPPTNTALLAQALSATRKVVPRTRPPPSVSTPSDPDPDDTRTLSHTNTDTARLSISTSSTIPPSYRTRRSTQAGSIYAPVPLPPGDYPRSPSPPPAYTAQAPGAPPSAFRTPTRRREVQRPAQDPAPRKRLDGEATT
ncbi:hypothetical protein V8D89_000439 [Ganoderma adspersum]